MSFALSDIRTLRLMLLITFVGGDVLKTLDDIYGLYKYQTDRYELVVLVCRISMQANFILQVQYLPQRLFLFSGNYGFKSYRLGGS